MPEPQNDEKVIAVLLRDKKHAPFLRFRLHPTCFLNQATQLIYGEALEYVETADAVPTPQILKDLVGKKKPQVRQHLEGLVDRLFALSKTLDADSHKHLAHYAEEVEELWVAESAKRAMLAATERLELKDVDGAVAILQHEIQLPNSRFKHTDIMKGFNPFYDDYELREAHPELYAGVKTGFPSIDRVSGGHHRGELWVMVGGTGVGKSMFLDQVSVNVASNKKRVLLVTIENNLAAKQRRIYSNVCRVPSFGIKNASLTREQKEKLMSGIAGLPEDFSLEILEFPEGCCAKDILAFTRSIPHKFDYLVVDQITNMKPNHPQDFKTLDWKWFFMAALELRRLGQTIYDGWGIPVLSAIHAAGGTTDKKNLSTDDLALAKMVAAHADVTLYMTNIEGEYTLGASKFRDAKLEPMTVYPVWEYWLLREEPPQETYGQTVEQGEATAPAIPAPAPTPAPREDPTDFNPEKYDREDREREDSLAGLDTVPEDFEPTPPPPETGFETELMPPEDGFDPDSL